MAEGRDERVRRFQELYDRYRSDILAYLLRRLPKEDAADAFAEVFLVAWRRLNDIPDGHESRLWLYGVARNMVSRERASRIKQATIAAGLAQAIEVASISPDQGDKAARVLVALSELSEVSQELLRLVAWEGLAPREVAKVMGITANAARIRLYRARNELKDRMENDTPHQTPVNRQRETSTIPPT